MQKALQASATVKSDTTIIKRIRTTNYIVGIHYSETSKEDVKDKILRLIKDDIASGL